MNWREMRIKELEEHIPQQEEWLVDRAEFTKYLKGWLQKDKEEMARLKEELQSR